MFSITRGCTASGSGRARHWRISSSTGSTGYRRRGQKPLSFHASSQMVMASGWPFSTVRVCSRGRLKVALLVEDVVKRQQHLLLHEADPPAGEQRGNIARVLAFVWPAIHRAGGEDRAAQNRRAVGGVGRNLIQRLSRAAPETTSSPAGRPAGIRRRRVPGRRPGRRRPRRRARRSPGSAARFRQSPQRSG